jgi:hypothetical protein
VYRRELSIERQQGKFRMPMGLAVVGAGYWGPNLVRTALATPAFRLD